MQVFQLESHYLYHKYLAFAPGGRWLAAGAKVFTLIDTADGTLLPVPEIGCTTGGVAFVGGEDLLAYTPSYGGLTVFDPLTRQASEKEGPFFAVAGAPRSDTFFASVIGASKSHVVRLTTAGLSQLGGFAWSADAACELAISADGRRLAGWTGDRPAATLHVWNVDGPKLSSRGAMAVPFAELNNFAISADGARLAAVNRRGLTVWDTATRKEVFRSGKHRRGVTAVACHPSKPLIATGDTAGGVFFWDHAGNVLTRFDWKLSRVIGLAFAPDGLRCAAADDTAKVVIWDVDA